MQVEMWGVSAATSWVCQPDRELSLGKHTRWNATKLRREVCISDLGSKPVRINSGSRAETNCSTNPSSKGCGVLRAITVEGVRGDMFIFSHSNLLNHYFKKQISKKFQLWLLCNFLVIHICVVWYHSMHCVQLNTMVASNCTIPELRIKFQSIW